MKYVDIPLHSYDSYRVNISLQGNSYVLEFIFNSRLNAYTLSLYDGDNQPIVLGEALLPNYPLFQDYALQNLTGAFRLIQKERILSEPYKTYPKSLSEYYYFVYTYEE